MKTLAMTILLSGLLSAGAVFAADSQHNHDCKTACASHCQQDSTFKSLSSEYEVQPPIGG